MSTKNPAGKGTENHNVFLLTKIIPIENVSRSNTEAKRRANAQF